MPPVQEVQNDFLVMEDGLNVSLGSSISEDQPGESQAEAPLNRKLLKGKIQAGVQKRVSNFWREKVGGYVMQGDYLALHMEEESCLTWKSFLWDIPQGVLKFAINAGINTQPSADNLKRWGKRVVIAVGFVVTSRPWHTFCPIVPPHLIRGVLPGAMILS